MRPRAILADDYEAGRQLYSDLLAPDVDFIAIVGDGEAALEAAELQHPDLVFLDIAMPVLDGFSAARKLKKNMPQIKVVFLTMHAEPEYIKEAEHIGVDGYVLKRNASSELREAVRNVMEGSRYYPE